MNKVKKERKKYEKCDNCPNKPEKSWSNLCFKCLNKERLKNVSFKPLL